MSFLEDFIQGTKDNRSEYANHEDIADDLGATEVSYDIVGTWRWGDILEYVYQKDSEYVRVTYQTASGDGECDYSPEFKAVKPEVVTVTKYVAV